MSKSPTRKLPTAVFGMGEYTINASWVVELSRPGGAMEFVLADTWGKNSSKSIIGASATCRVALRPAQGRVTITLN
ncbi:hypothetical protein ACH492_39000 [Streptomyces sp. NPDC019443]|uniref:hypothetical protein n=1 Tax=Streptomyces sp. NPDC019443 TaxID=3365061 RepID=UPI0037A60C38